MAARSRAEVAAVHYSEVGIRTFYESQTGPKLRAFIRQGQMMNKMQYNKLTGIDQPL